MTREKFDSWDKTFSIMFWYVLGISVFSPNYWLTMAVAVGIMVGHWIFLLKVDIDD